MTDNPVGSSKCLRTAPCNERIRTLKACMKIQEKSLKLLSAYYSSVQRIAPRYGLNKDWLKIKKIADKIEEDLSL